MAAYATASARFSGRDIPVRRPRGSKTPRDRPQALAEGPRPDPDGRTTGGSDCKQNTQPGRWRTAPVSYQTTIGYSLISSGIVTLLLAYLPGDSLWWGIGLLVLGIAVFFLRR